MKLHHSKHHQTYVNVLNVAEEQYADAAGRGDTRGVQAVLPALKYELPQAAAAVFPLRKILIHAFVLFCPS